jgi:SOUL heme-binding protein
MGPGASVPLAPGLAYRPDIGRVRARKSMWQSIVYYAVLALESAVGVFGIRLYEEPRYDVVDHVADQIEIRHYAPRLSAEVELPGADKAARGEAFQLLFAYIAGANSTSASGTDKIAMTVPVEVRETERMAMTVPVRTSEPNGTVRMSFFLPAKYSRDDAPIPVDDRVRLTTVSDETIAILPFSGSGSDFAERQSELLAKLAGSRWRPIGLPYTFYYDAPFTLPFLRRNEAAVVVVKTP